jgi:hypothetical protein
MTRVIPFAISLLAIACGTACPGPVPNENPPFDCSIGYRAGMPVEEMDYCFGPPCTAQSMGGGFVYTYCPTVDTCEETCPRRLTVGVNADGVSTWSGHCPETGCPSEPPASTP